MDWTLLTRICLVIASLFDIIPGFVHFLASDGGAGSIAGIVLTWENTTTIQAGDQNWDSSSYHQQSILVMFNALGLIQIKLGVIISVLAVLLSQDTLLYILTLMLISFQAIKIVVDLFDYRNIHSIAPYAPGGYKPPVVAGFYVIATISQMIWYNKNKQVNMTTKQATHNSRKIKMKF